MTADWTTAWSAVASLAVFVALSPLPVGAVLVLMLQTARPKRTGTAFLAGRMVGLVVLAILAVEVPDLIARFDRQIPGWAGSVGLAVGIASIAFGVWRWRTRGAPARSSRLWDWIGRISPAGAAVLGLVFTALNTKAIVATAGAGYAIGTVGLSTPVIVAAMIFYVLVAGSTVIVPVVAYAIAAERIDPRLSRAKAWIERHQNTMTAVSALLIGIALVLNGIRGL